MKAVNLVPSEHRKAVATGGLAGGAYAVLGVLAVLLVMAVMYVLTSNNANQSQTKADSARQKADAMAAQTKQLGAFTDFSGIKEQRLASVMGAADTRFDWERFMRELSRVIPEDSWVQTTDAKVADDDRPDRRSPLPRPRASRRGPPPT